VVVCTRALVVAVLVGDTVGAAEAGVADWTVANDVRLPLTSVACRSFGLHRFRFPETGEGRARRRRLPSGPCQCICPTWNTG
jgi:hypothetical protein